MSVNTCRLMRIDWETVGRIIKRVGDELLPADRLTDLFDISLDEVAWRKGHRYLTLVGDHREGLHMHLYDRRSFISQVKEIGFDLVGPEVVDDDGTFLECLLRRRR